MFWGNKRKKTPKYFAPYIRQPPRFLKKDYKRAMNFIFIIFKTHFFFCKVRKKIAQAYQHLKEYRKLLEIELNFDAKNILMNLINPVIRLPSLCLTSIAEILTVLFVGSEFWQLPNVFSWELNIPKLLVVEELGGANFHGFIFLWAREDEIFVNFSKPRLQPRKNNFVPTELDVSISAIVGHSDTMLCCAV